LNRQDAKRAKKILIKKRKMLEPDVLQLFVFLFSNLLFLGGLGVLAVNRL
jgi:hypothetical protein